MSKQEKQHHEEMKMELQGVCPITGTIQNVQAPDQDQADNDQISKEPDMSELTMSRRKRGLYESICISKRRRKAKVDHLESRKRSIAKNQ
uniref:Uncharacterized protein n=1 Tax=Chenopodium quinoa TaxID=63459 RepID=A0A803MP48_CHEQI